MSATTTSDASDRQAVARRAGPLTGTATLVRFALRRDRVRLPVWALGIALYLVYCVSAIPSAYGEEDLPGAAAMLAGPMSRLLTGPAIGFELLSYEVLVAGGYGLYAIIFAALMSILLVARHTRADEQAGRAELVRSSVVGRHASLTAALVVAVVANLVVAALSSLVVLSAGYATAGSLVLGASIGAAGIAFAGVAALTVQVTESSRAAAGLAGAGLAAAFVLRAAGDLVAVGGSALSWLSPLGWSQQTGPYALDRWWPLVCSLAFALVLAAVGYLLSTRRDVGASLVPPRPGPPSAAAWLRSPLALAFRLQRAAIAWWVLSLVIGGFVFGLFVDAMLDTIGELPEAMLEVLGGEADVVGGYLGLTAFMMAVFVGFFVVLSVQALRTEETVGRLEPVLATISRTRWLVTNLVVTALGAVALLAVTGVAAGLGAVLATGEAAHLGELVGAHLAYAPAVLVVLALAVLLLAFLPGAIAATWVVVGYALAVGTFGPMLQLPELAYDLSPFEHVARLPLEPFAVAPLLMLTALAAAGILVALLGFRRRDLHLT